MSYMNPARFLNALKKTPVILKFILSDVSNEHAREATDGADGWSVVEVMGHLLDFEQIFYQRTRAMVEQEIPRLQSYDQDELVRERNYRAQDVHTVYEAYLQHRRELVAYLSALSEDQWHCRGVHLEYGEIDVFQQAMQVVLHDVTHIEQILKALDKAEALF